MTPSPRPLGQGFGHETSLVEAGPDVLPHRHAADEPPADRLHNRENPSPSEMAEMLREVQDSLAALDERVAGLEGAQGDSSQVTRRVALNVAEMGESLARRVRALEKSDAGVPPVAPLAAPAASPFAPAQAFRPAPRRRANRWGIILRAAVLLGVLLIGLWVFGRWRAGATPAAPSLAPAAAPTPVSGPPAAAPPVTATAVVHRAASPAIHRPRRYSLYPARRPFTRPQAPAIPVADGPPPIGYGSFGPAAVPTPATAPPR